LRKPLLEQKKKKIAFKKLIVLNNNIKHSFLSLKGFSSLIIVVLMHVMLKTEYIRSNKVSYVDQNSLSYLNLTPVDKHSFVLPTLQTSQTIEMSVKLCDRIIEQLG